MIISASRRTDIPAFYTEWFMNRIRSGFCIVPNPFNARQISHISLKPEDVDAIVFWTRNPRPLFPYLTELDERGYRYYFLYTLMANPGLIDPGSPRVEDSIETFRDLSFLIGPKRVIWRYDPILFTSITGPDFHEGAYRHIARSLKGRATRSIVSIAQMYRKTRKRMSRLAEQGIEILPYDERMLSLLMGSLAQIAADNGMEIQSCADELDLQRYGISPGKCVNEELLSNEFGLRLEVAKDACQRKKCNCAASKDIGMYDSCLFGCVYCYATTSFERARENYRRHDKESPSLLTLRGQGLASKEL